ncbi:MAG: hypothetical protein OXL38_04465 [Gammaproteobacteria bacterium]|nr:hypothetical protein [Gammaproteobacteria bacterium]MDE0441357.1 hypothetical protein [Gammaproteobacteria bacterium]
MHSSILRGSDFQVSWRGRDVSHQGFFRDHGRNTRVGLLAPDGTEGVGAVTLAMAYVTAFYDGFRKEGGGFFAYPDFFTFQRRDPLVDYGYFDFWPDKDVRVADDHNATAAAIADRAINVLLVPDSAPTERGYEPVQDERIRRSLARCFLYSRHGDVADANLVIRCAAEPLGTYVANVLRSADEPMPNGLESPNDERPALEQSFRETTIDDALMRL